jgi:sugar lactone lactonase YvrE
MKRTLLPIAALLIAACSAEAPKPPATETKSAPPSVTLERLWVVEGLSAPESAALSADGTFLFVSNIAGEPDAKDGDGFISRVGVDGRLIEAQWVSGLNAPKGVVRVGDTLFVTDIDVLAVIDIPAKRVAARIPAPDARFLNDVAVAPDGTILASDSDVPRIFALAGDALAIWAENPLLADANGLLPEPDRLWVTTMQGRLLSVDYATRAIETRAEGLGAADGIVRVGEDFLVTEWPGLQHLVRADGSKTTILDTRSQNIYQNDTLIVGDTYYVPNWMPGTLTAYRVHRSP